MLDWFPQISVFSEQFGDILRTVILIQAFWMGGVCLWFYRNTVYISGKLMLIHISLFSLGAMMALVANLGEKPNWGHPLLIIAYSVGLYGLKKWREERMPYMDRNQEV